jgi:hypothetical protein
MVVAVIGTSLSAYPTLGSLYGKPAEAKKFYVTIGVFTLISIGLNFFGIDQ